MKISEIIVLSDTELREKLENATSALIQLKLNHSVSPLENPSQIKAARRDIARLQTEIRQRELKNK